ncbi:MAG: hypothetical protein HGB29_09795 [Chlorobiaceae bacterium]|nr:hypothetical protein [Chlorobiaceae bacterium]
MTSRNTRSDRALYLMFALMVIGARFMIVAAYGNAMPVWDQWDAEIDRLFRPWMEGTLRWQELFAAHNEHRVFTGRVLALLLFVLNGQVLNPMLEMVANAILFAGALLLLLYGLLGMLPDGRNRLLIMLFASLLFSIPLGVENILLNNSALYFIIFFSMVFLLALSRRSGDFSFWDIVALLSGLLACLSFASGVLTLAAGIFLLGLQWFLGVMRTRSTVVMMVLLVLMLVLFIKLTPSIQGHDQFRSRTLLDFIVSILRMTGGLVFFVPSVVFIFRQLRHKPGSGDPTWFLVALCLWVFGQMVVIAYGRGHSNVLTSRYRDLYAIGYLANLAAFLVLMRDPGLNWKSWPLKAWLITFCAIIMAVMPLIVRDLSRTRALGIEYEARVRTYLTTHDENVLIETGAKLPYPDPVRLKTLLDRKIVREMLPKHHDATDRHTSGFYSWQFAGSIFLIGSILAGSGLVIFCYLVFYQRDMVLLRRSGAD